MKGLSKALILVFVLSLFNANVYAVEQGGYIGFSIGQADDDILDESDSGYKLLAGFATANNTGIEVAFVDLGSYVNNALDQYGVAFDAIGYLPLGNNIDVFGKLGLFLWTVDVSGATDDGTDLTYGFGGSVQLDSRIAVRAEWERFTDVSGGDVDLLSAGITYRF